MRPNAEEIIRELKMFPLDMEGGYCTERYQSHRRAEDGRHLCGSAIYYLLKGNERSAWHMLQSDEIWFYHAGVSAVQLLVAPDGSFETVVIGADVLAHEQPQQTIPAGYWQTTVLSSRRPEDWGLFGTAVIPGFEYAEFTGASDEEMLTRFPQIKNALQELLKRGE